MQADHGSSFTAAEVRGLIPRSVSAAGCSRSHACEIEALHARLHAKEEQTRQMERELDGSRSQIVQDADTIQHLKGRVDELEELVQKQKATIANQSKAISDPRTSNRHQQLASAMYPATPQHQVAQASYQTPASMRSQYSAASNVYDYPPPKFDLDRGKGMTAGPATSLVSGVSAFGYDHINRNRFHCAIDSVSSFAYADVERNAAELGKRFQGLFGKTEMFGWAHANMPNVHSDSRLGKEVKDYIMSVSDQSTASLLLGNQKTRYFLVAKAINVYVANEILKITAIRGFDMGVDAEIGKLKKQLFPDTPASVRQLLVAGMVNQTNIAKRKPGFAEFCQTKVQQHLTQLWQLIGPLTADRSNRACTDLSSIVSEAQVLAVDMYSAPFEYKFEFPVTGEAFNPTEMVHRDPAMTADPKLLRSSDAKVRLGISPSVRIRNDSENLAVIKQGHLANVLLRQQARQREFTAAVFTKNGMILS